MNIEYPFLSVLIWFPIVTGGLLFFLRNQFLVKWISFIVVSLMFALACYLGLTFDLTLGGMQWQEKWCWIPSLNIEYALGVDGFSLPFVLLTTLIGWLVVILSLPSKVFNVQGFLACFLILQGLLCGVFSALDGLLFYLFWEATLIPMFFIIGLWGGSNKIYATFKFFLFTFFGSVFFLLALIYLQGVASSFEIQQFYALNIPLSIQKWLFWGMLIAFAVKIPMLPVHTWLPDAHTQAPTAGSVVLAAILLKLGGYALLRFLLPIVPEACLVFSPWMVGLSVGAILYIGLVTLVQKHLKKLIAYSSIAHMGFVTLGCFVPLSLLNMKESDLAIVGIEGAMVQMISHGLIAGALFVCVGLLIERVHSKKISDYGGLAKSMPLFSCLFMLFALGNVGLPGTSGFVGEWLVLLSSFAWSKTVALLASFSLIVSACYTLWMFKRVVFGTAEHSLGAELQDLTKTEAFVLGVLGVMVLVLGLWPAPLLDMLHGTTLEFTNRLIRVL